MVTFWKKKLLFDSSSQFFVYFKPEFTEVDLMHILTIIKTKVINL
jgi:hypothetical protein